VNGSVLNQEDSFLPFSTAECPQGPWLVFAPHADDETYGMGGAILQATAHGLETHLVVLTDGALGGEASDLINIRRRESEKAARELGISTLDYWMEEDRSLKLRDSLVAQTVKKIEVTRPLSIFFPSPMEVHPDHRATALLVWSAIQLLSADQRPTAYSYEISVQSPINMLLDITEQAEKKAAVMKIYDSQNSQNNYEDLVRSLDKARTFSLPSKVNYAEGFYCYSPCQLENTLFKTLEKIVSEYLILKA
jgi:LmbE family N-acetylglucosaminyl deacetylase